MVDQEFLRQLERAGSDPDWRFFACPAPSLDALEFLSAQSWWPRFYWRSRDGQTELAALGSAAAVHSLAEAEAFLATPPLAEKPMLVGGLAFDPQQPQWPGFPAVHLFVPQLLWQRQGDHCRWLVGIAPGDSGIDQWRQLAASLKPAQPLPHQHARGEFQDVTPNRTTWQRWIYHSLNSPLSKVVLARRSTVHLADHANPFALLDLWRQAVPKTYPFLLATGNQSTFLGCSPERLFARHGRQLFTEAQAGTIAMEDPASTPPPLWQSDTKLELENNVVADDIIHRLTPLAQSWQVGPTELNPLVEVAHLRRQIEATLHEHSRDSDLLAALHPTPAVGGVPRRKALAHIRATENFVRGWYAGAVGFLSHERSEMTVAIRSALVEDDRLHLYAGVGLVNGSDAEDEWQELNHKVTTILKILGLAP